MLCLHAATIRVRIHRENGELVAPYAGGVVRAPEA